MAGMSEGSYVKNVTPGIRGIWMNESSEAMAHMSAMVTSCFVDHLLVFSNW